MTAEEQERQNIIKWTEKQPWFKAFLKNLKIQHSDYKWPESYDTGCWDKKNLIAHSFIWSETKECHDFWSKIHAEFTVKYSEGFFKSPVKATKIDPKNFSMVRKREKNYKFRYKL